MNHQRYRRTVSLSLVMMVSLCVFSVNLSVVSSEFSLDTLTNLFLGQSTLQPSFPLSRFYPVSVGIDSGFILTSCDLNADKYNDLVAVQGSLPQRLVAYLWSSQQFSYIQHLTIELTEEIVVGGSSADFNNDGIVDILILRRSGDNSVLGDHVVTAHVAFSKLVMNDDIGTFVFGEFVTVTEESSSELSASTPIIWYGHPSVVVDSTLNINLIGRTSTNSTIVMTLCSHNSLLCWHKNSKFDFRSSSVTGTSLSQFSCTSPGRGVYEPLHEDTMTTCKHVYPMRYLSIPSSITFEDMDGDCMVDVVLTSSRRCDGLSHAAHFIEIWMNTGNDVFSMSASRGGRVLVAPDGMQRPLLTDVDRDGSTDLVIPVCLPEGLCATTSEIRIYLNRQRPLCTTSDESGGFGCRSWSDLCIADHQFDIDCINQQSDTTSFIAISSKTMFESGFTIRPALASAPSIQYPSITALDYDMDGAMDLLIPIIKNGCARISLWRNTGMTSSDGEGLPPYVTRPMFELVSDDDMAVELFNIDHGYMVSVTDFGETGTPDVVVSADPGVWVTEAYRSDGSSTSSSTSSTSSTLHPLFNNIGVTARHVKALCLNGHCGATCAAGPGQRAYSALGAFTPGAVVKFLHRGKDGDVVLRSMTQRPSSTYGSSTHNPSLLFGLHSDDTFIFNFFVGLPLSNDTSTVRRRSGAGSGDSERKNGGSSETSWDHVPWKKWQSILPNANVFIIPYPPWSSAAWTLEQFISPSRRLALVSVVMVAVLVVIGFLILGLHVRENAQDRHERERSAHLYSFSSL